mgnify:CR=1 FL=1
MNILDIQDNLKNFSEKQLINEMQMPSGNAPQFLVLSEITRRKRMRDQLNMQKAANEPTVAQEAVASAGVPVQGIMGMSEAMAPKAAMADGGIGSVMSQPMKSEMPIQMRSGGLMQYGREIGNALNQEKVEPFLDEIEGMTNDKFGVDPTGQTTILSNLNQGPLSVNTIPRPLPFDFQQQLFQNRLPQNMGNLDRNPLTEVAGTQDRGFSMPAVPAFKSGGSTRITERRMKNGKIGLFRGNTFLGTKDESGGIGTLAEKIGFGAKRNVLDSIKEALGFAEGGVIEAQSGAYFPSSSELYGLFGQESGYGKNLFGSAGEIGPYQILPTTAIMPGNQIKSLFPELEAAIARGDYPSAAAAYEANKAMVDEALMSGEKVEPFVLDYLDNAERVLGNRNLATLAFNQGIAGTKGFSGDVLDTDYVSGVRSNMSGYEDAKPKSMVQKAIDTVVTPAAASALYPTQNVETAQEKFDKIQADKMSLLDKTKDLFGIGDPEPYEMGGRSFDDAIKYQELGPDGYNLMRRLGYSEDDIEKAKSKGVPPEFFETKKGFNEGVLSEEGIRAIDGSSTDQSDIPLRGDSGLTVTAPEDLAPSRRTGEERGERAAYEASLRDDMTEAEKEKEKKAAEEKDTTKKGSVEQPVPPVPPSAPKANSLEAEILKLQEDMKKSREQDKWLSLAQAGLALMSSKEPTLLGALGEAGLSGLGAMKEAESRYQEGVIDLINARSKLKKTTPRLEDKDVLKSVTDILSDPLADRTSEDYLEARRVYDIIMARNNYGRIKIPPQAAS